MSEKYKPRSYLQCLQSYFQYDQKTLYSDRQFSCPMLYAHKPCLQRRITLVQIQKLKIWFLGTERHLHPLRLFGELGKILHGLVSEKPLQLALFESSTAETRNLKNKINSDNLMSAGRTAVLSDTKDHIQIKNLPPFNQ